MKPSRIKYEVTITDTNESSTHVTQDAAVMMSQVLHNMQLTESVFQRKLMIDQDILPDDRLIIYLNWEDTEQSYATIVAEKLD